MTRWKRLPGIAVVVVVVAALAVSGPAQAGQRDRIEVGSILVEITQGSPAALVGMAVSANQGLEKTISYPIPRLGVGDTSIVIPLLLLNLRIDEDNGHVLFRSLDTLLFLTNSNPANGPTLSVQVTFRRSDGTSLNAPVAQSILAGQTAVLSAATTLNP